MPVLQQQSPSSGQPVSPVESSGTIGSGTAPVQVGGGAPQEPMVLPRLLESKVAPTRVSTARAGNGNKEAGGHKTHSSMLPSMLSMLQMWPGVQHRSPGMQVVVSGTQHLWKSVEQVRLVDAQHSPVASHTAPLVLQHLFLHNGQCVAKGFSRWAANVGRKRQRTRRK